MSTAIAVGQAAIPIFGPLLLAMLCGAAPFFIHKGLKLLHINLTAAQEAALDTVVQRKANTMYGNMVSLGQTVAAKPVVNNAISQAASEILVEAPKVLTDLNITPAGLQDRIAAAFGANLVEDTQVTIAAPKPAVTSVTPTA